MRRPATARCPLCRRSDVPVISGRLAKHPAERRGLRPIPCPGSGEEVEAVREIEAAHNGVRRLALAVRGRR